MKAKQYQQNRNHKAIKKNENTQPKDKPSNKIANINVKMITADVNKDLD